MELKHLTARNLIDGETIDEKGLQNVHMQYFSPGFIELIEYSVISNIESEMSIINVSFLLE